MPRLRRREEAINKQLLPMFGPDLVWRYEDIVPRNQEFDKAVALDGWNAGLLTKDEAREKLGMPPAPVGGDVYKTTFSDVFVHEDDDPAALSVAAANLQYADGAPPLQESGSEDIEITQGGDPILSSGVEGEGNTAVEITDREEAAHTGGEKGLPGPGRPACPPPGREGGEPPVRDCNGEILPGAVQPDHLHHGRHREGRKDRVGHPAGWGP